VNIIVILLSVALLVIGVEIIASGIVVVVLSSSLQKTKKSSGRRKKVTPFTNIGLGAVAIVFSIIALASPALMSERSLTLLSVAISVMFNGFARVIQGAFDKNQPTWFRTFSIGIGTQHWNIYFCYQFKNVWNPFSYSYFNYSISNLWYRHDRIWNYRETVNRPNNKKRVIRPCMPCNTLDADTGE
jgi:hypothetical protein